jgi:hypothetical protein
MCLNLSAEKINDGKGDPVEETKHKSSLTETKESPPPTETKEPPGCLPCVPTAWSPVATFNAWPPAWQSVR